MKRIQTPFFLFVITAVVIATAEFLVMLLLSEFGEMTLYEEALFDSLLLSIVVFPLLFLFLFDPMLRYSEERERAVDELQKVRGSLEELVHERTERLLELNQELKKDIDAREQIERKLAQSEQYLKTIFESEPQCVAILDREAVIRDINPAGAAMLQASSSEQLIGRSYETVPAPEYHIQIRSAVATAFTGKSSEIEYQAETLLGQHRTFSSSFVPLQGDHMIPAFVLLITRDVTDEKKLESQFLHGQKMEALGRVASGVAHDFNNILTSIMGNAELIMESASPGSDVYEEAQTVLASGKKATRLTKQLLAFSKKQVFQLECVDINHVATDIRKMLSRVLGENIAVEMDLCDTACMVNADIGQLEQVVMNLAVNAMDAMPNGGTLKISTSISTLDESYASEHLEVPPGTYVILRISDTGMGIPKSAADHIFEPFYTTKEGGTGLGLSTVYGIMKQLGGNISVYSEPGEGTTFKLLFPASSETNSSGPLVNSKIPDNELHALDGRETVIVVEDDAGIRDLVESTLTAHGYKVIIFGNGNDAASYLKNVEERPDLLLTDVVLPGSRGPEVADAMLGSFPDAHVLYMSGYTDSRVNELVQSSSEINFIAKPFTPKELLVKLRSLLDGHTST